MKWSLPSAASSVLEMSTFAFASYGWGLTISEARVSMQGRVTLKSGHEVEPGEAEMYVNSVVLFPSKEWWTFKRRAVINPHFAIIKSRYQS